MIEARPNIRTSEQTAEQALQQEVLLGLLRPEKQLPCQLFYDERGSALFEQICGLDEYYLTRTEIGILKRHAAEMAALIGPRVALIELGSGNSAKSRILLDSLADPAAYIPVDLSRQLLLRSAAAMARAYPGLPVLPLAADYTRDFSLPKVTVPYARQVGFFPGSTIGNLLPEQTSAFLHRLREMLGPGGGLLLGLDLQKDPALLHRAYNDRAGVTAAFNLNILTHINRRFGADFRPERFVHQAHYERPLGRIEMHLVSRVDQQVRVAGHDIRLRAGERILTEVSYKYDLGEFADTARQASLNVQRRWTDERGYFGLLWLVPD
jgi:dimethylhistidine N-methyltransferase